MSDECRKAFEEWLDGYDGHDRGLLTYDIIQTIKIWQAAWSARGDGWVSAKERLPEIGQKVFAYRPTAHLHGDDPVTNCVFTGRDNKSLEGVTHQFDRINHVTHWQPLPEPPKGDE